MRLTTLAAAVALAITGLSPQAVFAQDTAPATDQEVAELRAQVAALMTRMIADLVSRILAVTDQVTDPAAFATQSTEALFDAFEAKPVARLAAWLELTGESRRLTTVREAVRSVLSTRMVEQTGMPVAVVEDFILLCLSMALGVGLFGGTLGSLLGRPESRARDMALAILQRRVDEATLALKGG